MKVRTKEKVNSIICILILSVLLVGCGETNVVSENANSKVAEENSHDAKAVEALEIEVASLDKTEEPAGEPTVEPTGELMEEATSEPTEEPTEKPTDKPREEFAVQESDILEFSVEVISEVLYPNRNLNVRMGPSTSYERLGSVMQNQKLSVTGITENGWYEIDYNGQKGYCSGHYLVSEPIIVATPEVAETPVFTADSEVPTEVPTEVVTQAPVVSASASVNELLNAVNADRAANGLSSLTLDADLQNTAAVRAAETAVLFDHTRPDGTDCFTAFPASAGPSRAENIYMSSISRSAAEVEAAWMASAGHQANILNATYTKIGIGIYQASNGYWYYVQDFSN